MNKLKMATKTVKTGWAMLRVSTAAQADVQHGSLEQQHSMVSRWAKQESEKSGCLFKIVRFIEEDISGRSEHLHKRVELRELEMAIENREIDFFVVEKLDRLTRSQIYNLQIREKAEKYGVEFYEYESGLIDFKDRGKRLGFNIKNMMAEEYSLELEEKVTKKMREAMVNNGKDSSSMPVLGLDCHPTMVCLYTINKAEQRIVIDIFSKFVELANLKALANYCAQMNYRTKVRITEKKIDKNGLIVAPRQIGGELFNSKTLRQLLGSDKIRGMSKFLDSWNQFPKLQDESGFVSWEYAHFKAGGSVVPAEIYTQVQEILEINKHKKTRSKTAGEVYLLSGILFKENGDNLVGASAKSGSNHYYEDRKANEFRIPKEALEHAVCNRISMYLKQTGVVESILRNSVNDKSDGVGKIDEDIKRLKHRISEHELALVRFSECLRSAALEGLEKLNDVCKMINEEKSKLEAELALSRKQLNSLESKKSVLSENFKEKTIKESLKAIWKDFSSGASHQKKQVLHSIVQRIVIRADNKLEIVINPFFKGPNGSGPSGLDSGGHRFGCGKIGWGSRIRTCE